MTQGQPSDKLASNPWNALLQNDGVIPSDFFSQEPKLEHSERLHQVRTGAELKNHSIERRWRGHDGVVHTQVMRTKNCGEATKSG